MDKQDNKISYIELPAKNVEDLTKAKEFLNGVFGWTYQQWGDDYADTQDSGLSSGISADNPPHGPLVVIYVVDLLVTHDKVVQSSGVITKDIFSFPGGKRFHFKDPAGNELAVWSE